MLNQHDTQLVIENFFRECQNYHRKNTNDEREVFAKALNDVSDITSDPYSPYGKKLDVETKNKFIKYREMDLGIRG